MFCQHCRRDIRAVRCPHCLETVDVADVERVEQLAYLRNRLDGWAARGTFSRRSVEQAIAETEGELRALHVRLGLLPPAPLAPVSDPPTAPPFSSTPGAATPPPSPAPPEATDSMRAGEEGLQTPPPPVAVAPGRRRRALNRPPLTWRQVGLALLSERTLNTLLLVGALLILASASVISTLNPTRLAPVPHLGALVVTTAVFALAGLALRHRFGLPRTGGALLAIAAVFLPLDVWTLGGAELLRWPPATTWLVASTLCLLAYLGLHLLLRDRTFALLSAAAGASLTLAAAARAGVATDWWAALLVLLAVLYVALAPRVGSRLPLLARALRGAGHVLALGALALSTLVASAALAGLTFAGPGSSAASLAGV